MRMKAPAMRVAGAIYCGERFLYFGMVVKHALDQASPAVVTGSYRFDLGRQVSQLQGLQVDLRARVVESIPTSPSLLLAYTAAH